MKYCQAAVGHIPHSHIVRQQFAKTKVRLLMDDCMVNIGNLEQLGTELHFVRIPAIW